MSSPTGGVQAKLHKVEQRLVGICIAVMGTVVFLDVVHRTASRENGLFQKIFGDAPWVNPAGTATGLAVSWLLVFAALRTRGRPGGSRTVVEAGVLTAVLYGLLRLFLVVVPNGIVWSQTLGLVLMLWVGCIGASMAAYEHRHLALDLGSKLWPRKLLPYAQAAGNLITALFCIVLVVLSVVSIRSHYGDYADTAGAGGAFVALPIPKWIAFTAIPVGFAMMAGRFLGQFVDSIKGHVEEDDPLQMLGLSQSGDEKKEEA
ncbi:MAG: TRAP transporter small permease [Myxococcota bacterium]